MISGLQYFLLSVNPKTVNPNLGGFYFLRVIIFIEYHKVQIIIQTSLPRTCLCFKITWFLHYK